MKSTRNSGSEFATPGNPPTEPCAAIALRPCPDCAQIHLSCPRCGERGTIDAPEQTPALKHCECRRCGLPITVVVMEPQALLDERAWLERLVRQPSEPDPDPRPCPRDARRWSLAQLNPALDGGRIAAGYRRVFGGTGPVRQQQICVYSPRELQLVLDRLENPPPPPPNRQRHRGRPARPQRRCRPAPPLPPRRDAELGDSRLERVWQATLAALELPSTRMLLSHQARLERLDDHRAEVAVAAMWLAILQTRQGLIEQALQQVTGRRRAVVLRGVRRWF